MPASKKYKEREATLEDYLNPKPLTIAKRLKFHYHNQQEGETAVQYMAALHKLMEHCEFWDYLEEVLQDRLVYRLRSEAV